VLFRLIDSKGAPNVKIAATEDGSAMSLVGESNPTHVQVLVRGTNTSLTLVNKDGRQQGREATSDQAAVIAIGVL